MATVANQTEAKRKVQQLLEFRSLEANRLERVFLYLRNFEPGNPRGLYSGLNWRLGPLRWLPEKAPAEVRRLAEISRVNVLRYIVNAGVQVMFVDGYKARLQADDAPPWDIWQANRLDAYQVGVHRSAIAYGASYVSVLPGEPVPVIQGISPRKLTAVYGESDDWPDFALEQRRSPVKDKDLWRLYDDGQTWWIQGDASGSASSMTVVKSERHDVGYVPIVRFLPTVDDDGIIEGEVEPHIPLQDQINMTTFGLLVAQHYGAFRQRYIMGWLAETEDAALEAGARKVWTFEDPDVKAGEFGQTDLGGYLDSREKTLQHLATLSSTPAHELLGQIANLSAEALAAAEASRFRANAMRQTVMGESWEQVLELAGEISTPPQKPDPSASVRWRDMEARSLSQIADALGKLATQLGIPPQELWDRIPGVSQQEIDRWKAAAKEGDAFAQLTGLLNKQAQGAVAVLEGQGVTPPKGTPGAPTPAPTLPTPSTPPAP